MSKTTFFYKGNKTTIQCDAKEKMKDILKRLSYQLGIDLNKINFFYYGEKINEELTFIDIIKQKDKESNEINIYVIDINEKIKISKEIICPICKENIFIEINDYHINLLNCKNNHSIKNLYIQDFENTQKIDLSKIICDICKSNNKNETHNNEFYKCLNCNLNICPDCKSVHDENDILINYEKKNFICNIHYQNYIKYCIECNKNLCMKCFKDHKNHQNIFFGDILPNENIKEELNKFKNYINKLNDNIQTILNKLNNIINNFYLYYNLMKETINNFNEQNLNYQTLKNINELMNNNNKMMNDIEDIIDDTNIYTKFNKLMNISYKIDNFIIAEFEINENDINKNIRIINSFEALEKDGKIKKGKEKYENEIEIKDKVKIEINNKIIPFSYNYKFKEKGKYIIKYSFLNCLTKADCLFSDCKLLTKIDLSNFISQYITNLNAMFYGCVNLKDINLSNFNTQNVTDMGYMFNGCKSLTNIDLSHFNTQNSIFLYRMFEGCKSLYSINLSNFNTQNVTNMREMFYGCETLNKINLSNFNTQNVASNTGLFNIFKKDLSGLKSMFKECKSLKKSGLITDNKDILEIFSNQ